MNRKKQRVGMNTQKNRLQRERQVRQRASSEISCNLTQRLNDAHDLIQCGDYDEAETLLRELDGRGRSNPGVLAALLVLYQKTGDHESCCDIAERLTKLCPRDADARFMYAQESVFCGRATIALLNYEEFVERWPNHPYVSKAKQAIEVLVPETERRIMETPFPPENALQWCYLHEESLAQLQQAKFADCITKCQDLLAKSPHFASARNNLAIACFHAGRAKDAIAAAEETRRMLPDNRFADATLAKLYFLTGRSDDAHQLADTIIDHPPTQQDSFVAALEVLAFLGRDHDVVQLAESHADKILLDQANNAIQLHYLAYAKCRLGDTHAAKVAWKQCLKFKHLVEAQENLEDLKVGGGNAPWVASLTRWIPKPTMDKIIDRMGSGKSLVLARYPGLASLIPALLDRGDPLGREAAMRLAMSDPAPSMLDALKDFAFGPRGPDSLRFETLQFLQKRRLIDAGPHRIFSCGKQTDIQLLVAEISDQPKFSNLSAHVLKLLEDGSQAMRENDFETAESAFSQALAQEPGNCSATYNLCTVWILRDGKEGEYKAIPHLEQLRSEHPDYTFAAIALAQLAAQDGEFQRARDLLAPCYNVAHMHTSEAIALFGAQAQIALAENDLAAAERAFDMLSEIANEDDPNVMVIRYRIDRASRRKGLRKLFSLW